MTVEPRSLLPFQPQRLILLTQNRFFFLPLRFDDNQFLLLLQIDAVRFVTECENNQ